MAQITCCRCGLHFESNVQVCPNCGQVMYYQQKPSDSAHTISLIALILSFIPIGMLPALVMSIIVLAGKKSRDTETKVMAIIALIVSSARIVMTVVSVIFYVNVAMTIWNLLTNL